MAFTKITPEDRQGKGNVGQPDTPLLTTTEMQEQMDSLPNLAIDKFNDFIDALTAATASNNIGCQVPDGVTAQNNLTSVLNAIAAEAQTSVALRHTHANKATLDAITSTLLENISALLLLMANIDTIDYIVTDSATAVPTSQAVQNYIAGYNYKSIIKNTLYPIGSVYQTTLVSPDTLFGTSNCWQLLSTDSNGVKTWKRIS
jgi:hypothetical protein